ncbi:MAG: LCP family protein, partial [Geodermatophilaceae bacterium]|nr:LCP family protein [Geodermatophilaceae bacterium]
MSNARQLPPRLDPRRQERRPSRAGTVLKIIAATLSIALLVGSGWVWYLRGTAEAALTRTDALPSDGNRDGSGIDGGDTNILLVGSDSRAGASDQQLREDLRTGDSGTMNTDTMMVVHLPADGGSATVVSFPRDSYVDIPGFGEAKLNSAYAIGVSNAAEGATGDEQDAAGAQLLVQTISALAGIEIDHYVQVDMLGFFNLTEVIGPVEVNLCTAVSDPDSGIDLPAGVQEISGADALSFVRQRKGLPGGDLDRIVRQQTFVGGVVRNLLTAGVLLNPLKQRDLVQAASESLTVDAGLDLVDLARRMQSLVAGEVRFQTVPIVDPAGVIDGSSVVLLEDPAAIATFFAGLDIDADAEPVAPADTSTVGPDSFTVEIYNGSGVGGLAADAAAELDSLGYDIGDLGNADRADYVTTEIRYGSDLDAQARTVALAVPGARLVPTDGIDGRVQLILGSEFTLGEATTDPDRQAGTGGSTPE